MAPSLHKSCAQTTKRNNQRRTEIQVPPSMHACIHVCWSCLVNMEQNLALRLLFIYFFNLFASSRLLWRFQVVNYIFIMQFVNTELNSYEFFLLFPMKVAGEFWPLDLSDIPAPHSLLPTCCLLHLMRTKKIFSGYSWTFMCNHLS